MKATITAAVGEFFSKTQEMVNNLLKIEYFHQKKLLCIHYSYTNISAKFLNIRCDTLFFKNSQISPFFQAVKLVLPLKAHSRIFCFRVLGLLSSFGFS